MIQLDLPLLIFSMLDPERSDKTEQILLLIIQLYLILMRERVIMEEHHHFLYDPLFADGRWARLGLALS